MKTIPTTARTKGNEMTTARMIDLDEIRQFILSPKAEFTLESKVTGVHCTYKRWDSNMDEYKNTMFISCLSGPDEWTYLGMLVIRDFDQEPYKIGDLRFLYTNKSPRGDRCFKALDWFLRHLAVDSCKLHQVEFHHAGKCCRCGRTLTTPDSIRSGIGPVCATRI